MTREEKIELLNKLLEIEEKNDIGNLTRAERREFQQWVETLEQEPQTFKWCDTCKEYDQVNHCCHRYSKVIKNTVEDMKREPIIDKIRAEITKYEGDCRLSVDEYPSCKQCTDNVFETIYGILDKYKAESEDKE